MEDRIDPVLFAQYLLKKAQENNIQDMSDTKLQKLLYAVDGVLLSDDLNIIDENCQTWQFGPVYPKVFKKITVSSENINNIDFSEIENHPHFDKISEDINLVLSSLGRQSAAKLSAWSHLEGSPWYTVMNDMGANSVIPKNTMKEYFKGIFKK